MYLIADSGSTKTDWCLCNQGAVLQNIQTQGINPYHQTEEAMQEFLTHVYSIVDYSVEKYLARGFKNLMVNFGCTGGQHRSVYSAEHLAAHLSEKYGVRILLEHREQKIKIETSRH